MTELTKIWKQEMPQHTTGNRYSNPNIDLSHLKKDLNNPEFQKKLKTMKNRQQEYIMNLLKRKGQIIELSGGGSIIISGPNMTSFTIPISLKKKPIEHWSEMDKIWLNM